ncbi:MAG: nicotinamide mononucleotide transporter, partial [Clostridia bacterium]|nr:nicotinamide mononucleotide transporter [Clostridia bacterium]
MKKKTLIIISLLISIVSLVIGILSNSGIFGTISLWIGFLNVFYMSHGKWYGYCFGIIYSLIYAIMSYIEGLYGVVITTILFYEPIQILGLISWLKNKNPEFVKTKNLTLKQNIILICVIIISSFSFGYLLSLINTQNMAFLDSTSQILNISANLLLMLRYREAWQIWVFAG